MNAATETLLLNLEPGDYVELPRRQHAAARRLWSDSRGHLVSLIYFGPDSAPTSRLRVRLTGRGVDAREELANRKA